MGRGGNPRVSIFLLLRASLLLASAVRCLHLTLKLPASFNPRARRDAETEKDSQRITLRVAAPVRREAIPCGALK